MIEIEVNYMGPVKRPIDGRQHIIQIEEVVSLDNFLFQLGYNRQDQRYLTISINGEKSDPTAILKDGDRLVVSLMVGGG